MKKYVLTLYFIFIAVALYSASTSRIPQLGKASIDKVVNAMTLEEKVMLLIGGELTGITGSEAGVGYTQTLVPGAAGTTSPITRLGIPAIVLVDGPAGVRIQPTRDNDARTYYCTAFPIGTHLASTWNTPLVDEVGQAIGNEVKEYGADVLLAPALNIQRNPLCGRNFEYYSEDPLLSGKIAAAMVKGVQSNGVGTSIKHFAVNNQETNRMANNVHVSQRALREIYLKGFEITVKEAKPWTVMSSYNYINGVYASESYELLTTILRDEWGFEGLVVTDWFGGDDAAAQMRAGNDLLMPGREHQFRTIMKAVQDGALDEEVINMNVKRLLQLIQMSPRFKKYKFSDTPDLKAHAEVTRQAASEGIVLLKNKDHALPLAKTVKSIAAFGTTSYDFIAGGTGSGNVYKAYTVSLADGLKNSDYQLDQEVASFYAKYMKDENERLKKDTLNPLAAFFNHPRIGECVPDIAFIKERAKLSDAAIITLGRNSGEFIDRSVPDDFKLTIEEMSLIANVCDAFHTENKKVVVILNVGGVLETAMWKELPDAILLSWQAGQEGGNAVADILSGKVNPSGKLPMTFPVNYMDAASSSNFPHDHKADVQQILDAITKGRGKKTKICNVDYTNYEEDIFVGYRYFDTFGKDVSYPFGYGLSYTTFEYDNPKVKETSKTFEVTFTVKNAGSVAGKEAVQLYIAAPTSKLAKPSKELKAFTKTKLLSPGEVQTLTMSISKGELASFDMELSSWVADAGQYELLLGASSRDIRQRLPITLSQAISEIVHDVLKPEVTLQLLVPQK